MKTYHLFIRDHRDAETVLLAMRDRDESTYEFRKRSRLVKPGSGGFVAEVVDGEIAGLVTAQTSAELRAIRELWAERRPDWLGSSAAVVAA